MNRNNLIKIQLKKILIVQKVMRKTKYEYKIIKNSLIK